MTEINIIIPNDSKVNNDEENETLIVNEDYFEQEDSQKSEEEGIISNEDKENECSLSVNQNENKKNEKIKKKEKDIKEKKPKKSKSKPKKSKSKSKNNPKNKKISKNVSEKKKETKINTKNEKKSKITKLSDYYVNYLYGNFKPNNFSNTCEMKHNTDFNNKINFDELFNIQNQNNINNYKNSSQKVLNTEKNTSKNNPNNFINRLLNYKKQQKDKLLYDSSEFSKIYHRDFENPLRKIESTKNSKKNLMKSAKLIKNIDKNELSNNLENKLNKKINIFSKSPQKENKNLYRNNYYLKRSASPKIYGSNKEKNKFNKKIDFNKTTNLVPHKTDLRITEIRAKNPTKNSSKKFNVINSKNKTDTIGKNNQKNNNRVFQNKKKELLNKINEKNKTIKKLNEENIKNKSKTSSKKNIISRNKSKSSKKDNEKESKNKTPTKKKNKSKEILIYRNKHREENKFSNSNIDKNSKKENKSENKLNRNYLSPIQSNNIRNKLYHSRSKFPITTKNSYSSEKNKSPKAKNNPKNDILLVNKINNQINEILLSKENDYTLFNENKNICFLGFCDILFDMGFLHIKESSIEDITKIEKDLGNVITQPYTNKNTLTKEFLFNEQMLLVSAWKTIKNNFVLFSKLEKLPKDNEEISIEDLKLFILIITGLYNGKKNNLQINNVENNSIPQLNNTTKNNVNELLLNKNEINNLDKGRLSEKNLKTEYNELIKKIEGGRNISNKMIQKIKYHFNYFNELRKLNTLYQKEIKDNKVEKLLNKKYSFRPKINSNNKILLTKFSPSMNFFQRSEVIKKRNAQKQSKLERACSEELFKECTFSPITNKKELNFSKSNDNLTNSPNNTPIKKSTKNDSQKNLKPFSDSKIKFSKKRTNNENENSDKNIKTNKENKSNNLHRGLKKSMFLKSPLSKDEFLNKRISKLRDNNFRKELNLYQSNSREILSNDVKKNIQKLKKILDSDKGSMRLDIEKKTNKDTFEKYKNPRFNDYDVVIYDDSGNEPLFTVEIKIKNIKKNLVVYPNNNLENLIYDFCAENKLGKISYDKIYHVIKNKMDEMKTANVTDYGVKSEGKKNFDTKDKKNNTKNNSYNNGNNGNDSNKNNNNNSDKKISRNNKLTNSPVRNNKEEEQKCSNVEDSNNIKITNINNENFRSYIKLYEDDKNELEIGNNTEINGDEKLK